MIAYSDSSVIQSLYLETLLHHPTQAIGAGELRRYHVFLNQSIVEYEVLTSESIELPRVNYPRCNTHPYQFAYGVGSSRPGNFIDQLVKVDVQHKTAQIWRSPNCYPGEPVFVAAPSATLEDEGVVLSVVLNVQEENSFLVVLDAQFWNELARVQSPYHLTFDFHGQYFDSVTLTQYLHR